MTNGPAHYVISDPSQEVLREQITSLPQRLKNPFKIMREWVKGEIFDLQSVLEAIGHKDGMEGAKTRTETRIRKDKETLDKMNAGKKTFKTLFKSSTGKASEITKITTSIATVRAWRTRACRARRTSRTSTRLLRYSRCCLRRMCCLSSRAARSRLTTG